MVTVIAIAIFFMAVFCFVTAILLVNTDYED